MQVEHGSHGYGGDVPHGGDGDWSYGGGWLGGALMVELVAAYHAEMMDYVVVVVPVTRTKLRVGLRLRYLTKNHFKSKYSCIPDCLIYQL